MKRVGFIQIPILVMVAISLVTVGVVVILRNQATNRSTSKNIAVIVNNEITTTTVSDVVPTTTKAVSNFPEEIEVLRREIEILKSAQKKSTQTTPQQPPQSIPPQPAIVQNTPVVIKDIVEHWRFFTAKLVCPLLDQSQSISSGGSGLVIKSSDGSFKILTNKHVIKDTSTCKITLSGSLTNQYQSGLFSFKSSEDFATISLGSSDEYLTQLLYGDPYYGICAENQKPALGDEIVILGYPGIGSKFDVTTTKGIISGFERNYFITDAKIDHGNSGGVAINAKHNCYFGLPTYGVSDTETLGRILDIWKVTGLF